MSVRQLRFRFETYQHPFVRELVERLETGGVEALQAADTEYRIDESGNRVPVLHADTWADQGYEPQFTVEPPRPVEDLDFGGEYAAKGTCGAYAYANWELFYFVPLTIAIHLSRDQRFEEAQRWFHFLFDPTDDSDGPTPQRFWKVKPFQQTPVVSIQRILVNLASGEDPVLRAATLDSIAKWRTTPFRPHAVARLRPSAYMFKTVIEYLRHLLRWGDHRFREDTRESITEATQLYVLAANILGPRPQEVPRAGTTPGRSYAELRNDLDAFGNALRALESEIPFVPAPPTSGGTQPEPLGPLGSVGAGLYFCVPPDGQLLELWDQVAQRLFFIRNSLNLQGVFRPLPLFAPPIDPALLARGAAAGVDVGAVVAGTHQPVPPVRFRVLHQQALELCQHCQALGQNLLSMMQSEDGEALSVLRARHESAVLEAAETIRYQQYHEAVKAFEALQCSLAGATGRYLYYERMLGDAKTVDQLPQYEYLDADELRDFRFTATEPRLTDREITAEIARDVTQTGGGKALVREELSELQKLAEARAKHETASLSQMIGGFIAVLPNFSADVKPIGVGAGFTFGGANLSALYSFIAAVNQTEAEALTYEAGKAGRMAGFTRRELDWALQSNLAAAEMNQLFKQLRAAEIRQSIAQTEWANHRRPMRQAEEIERFLAGERGGRHTTQAFYAYMKREVRGLHERCFELAFDAARRADRALQYELGDAQLRFVEPRSDSGDEALLAGERLYLDLKRMEAAYQDLNRREYELVKHVSLLQVNPMALLELRETGRCTFTLEEPLWDFDVPGTYFRRLRSVAVSAPVVAGPYESVNLKLTLLKSTIRTSAQLDGEYARTGFEDRRFEDQHGPVESIITSTGDQDSGTDTAGDERLTAFAGRGTTSDWRLELPSDIHQFDRSSLRDVILHVRYRAREAGELLRRAANEHVAALIEQASAPGSVRLFSMAYEFPTEWARFGAENGSPATLRFTLRDEHYPYWSNGQLQARTRLDVFAKSDRPSVTASENADGTGRAVSLTRTPALGGLLAPTHADVPISGPPGPTGSFELHLSHTDLDDLWIAVAWAAEDPDSPPPPDSVDDATLEHLAESGDGGAAFTHWAFGAATPETWREPSGGCVAARTLATPAPPTTRACSCATPAAATKRPSSSGKAPSRATPVRPTTTVRCSPSAAKQKRPSRGCGAEPTTRWHGGCSPSLRVSGPTVRPATRPVHERGTARRPARANRRRGHGIGVHDRIRVRTAPRRSTGDAASRTRRGTVRRPPYRGRGNALDRLGQRGAVGARRRGRPRGGLHQ